MVNMYDLANLTACTILVNKKTMERDGYWNDPMSMRGLLAHEHAHPLAENQTTRSSRAWKVSTSLSASQDEMSRDSIGWSADRKDKVQQLIGELATKLALLATREVYANELMISKGFGQALLHLDRGNVVNASRNVEGRGGLQKQLQAEVANGHLSLIGAEAMLRVADMQAYLDQALEIAPFYRAGQPDAARELESVLQAAVFPNVAPEVAVAYAGLCEHYRMLQPDLDATAMQGWGHGVVAILAHALANKGLALHDEWIAL